MREVGPLRTDWSQFLFWILALIVSAYIGSIFPDIDQRTDLLVHRSILTHGLLVPMVLFMIALMMKNQRLRDLVLIFMTSMAIHLCFDLFPSNWQGYALIHIPNIGRASALVSMMWMFTSIIFCLYACIDLIGRGSRGHLFVLGAISIFVYQCFGEAKLFLPLITLFFAIAVAVWLRCTSSSMKITIFVRLIRITIGTVRGVMKLLGDSYNIARDEYNIATQQHQPFHKFLLRMMWLWFLLLATVARRSLGYLFDAFQRGAK